MIYLIATNHLQNIKDSGVITGTSLSDHEMSFCVRKINWKAPLQQKTFRNYANYNPDKFLKDLKNTDFDLPSDNVNNKDVNELWQSFKDKFTNIAERHAPTIIKCVRGLNNCPWLNTSIKHQMRQRDYLQKKAHTTGLPSDWKRYRLQRNRVTNLIRKEKENYNRRLINENAGDPNSFWQTVKKILPSKSKKPSPKLKVNGQVITEKSSIANSFNNVFVNTAINLCKSFINAALNLSSSISLTRAMTSTFLFTDISESTVLWA